MTLLRRFSPFTLLLISVNGMIGSAWLFAPLYAAKIAGPGTIVAWLIGGLITVLIAFCFAEVSTLFPTAGGSTRIPHLSHGEFASFTMGWIAWLSCVPMAPIEVMAVLQYAATYFPSLTHVVDGAPALTSLGLVWATIVMAALCFINIASFKGLVGFNYILFWFKVIVIILVITMLMKTSFTPLHFDGIGAVVTSATGWHAILAAVSMGGIVFAFTGFKHGVELAGEAKNSKFAVPFGIIGSVVVCLILYLGLQIAFIGALPDDALKNGWGALSFAHDTGPFVGIAAMLGIMWLVKLLYIDAAVSPLGAGFIYVTSTSRIVYAMSERKYLPAIFSRVNHDSLPMWAIIFNFVIGMLLFLPFSGWQQMVSFLVSAVVISYAMGPVALLCLRKMVPHQKRPFRLPAAEILCFLAFYCCNLLSYWTGWSTISNLAIALGIGLVLFLIACIRKAKPLNELGLKAAWWIVPYLAGLVLISYLGSFGGKGIISFGWDFLVIAIFSAVMLYLAVAMRAETVSEENLQAMAVEN